MRFNVWITVHVFKFRFRFRSVFKFCRFRTISVNVLFANPFQNYQQTLLARKFSKPTLRPKPRSAGTGHQ